MPVLSTKDRYRVLAINLFGYGKRLPGTARLCATKVATQR